MFDWFYTYILNNKITVDVSQDGTYWIMPGLTLLAIIVAIFKETIVLWFYKPKLIIDCGNKGYYIFENYDVFDNRRENVEHMITYNIMVTNKSRNTCKNAIAEISYVYRHVVDDKYVLLSRYMPEKIYWVNGDRDNDIHYMQKCYLSIINLIKYHKNLFNTQDIYFAFLPYDEKVKKYNWLERNGLNIAKGKLKILLTIYADNMKPKKQWFDINWKGAKCDFEKSLLEDTSPYHDGSALEIHKGSKPNKIASKDEMGEALQLLLSN